MVSGLSSPDPVSVAGSDCPGSIMENIKRFSLRNPPQIGRDGLFFLLFKTRKAAAIAKEKVEGSGIATPVTELIHWAFVVMLVNPAKSP